jgi:methyl-accepting chemotaxis protein
MVAACVAAVTCVVGAVVAWRLLGDLQDRSATSLRLVQRTLENVDESLRIAQDVTATVGGTLDTVRTSLNTVATGIDDAGATLAIVADLTEDVAPSLDRVDEALGGLANAAGVVDGALEALDDLPVGPDYDAARGLAVSVQGVRDDLAPIADDLRGATEPLRDLSTTTADLGSQLATLDDDLDALEQSLAESTTLLDSYRADTAEASALASDSLDDLERDVTLSRILAVVLALSIAIGQVAPFHIGRQLAATPLPSDDASPDTIDEPLSSVDDPLSPDAPEPQGGASGAP